MQPRKHLLATCSVLLITALLAACAAPAAAPTATPVPPTATPGPLDVAMAYENAWNTFDANAVGALLAESFSATYDGYPASDPAAWLEEFPYGMARGSHMRIKLRDCQVSGDSVTCTVGSISDCLQMDAIETLTVKDGKITQLQHQTPPEEGAKSGAYFTGLIKWAESQDIPEARAYLSERAKDVNGYDWGVAYEAACKKYEAAKAQANDSTAVVQAWLDAINAGDLDAAMALMTPDAVIPGTGAPTRPARNVVDWWIDMESHFGAPDCQQADDRLVCNFVMTDHGCTVASGYNVGESMRYTFDMQDGKIHRLDKVSIASVGNDVSRYYKWLEEEMAWADTHHAEELAGIDWDGFSTGGGDIVVKLCREYAAAMQALANDPTAMVQPWFDAINAGDLDGALALMTPDAKISGVFTQPPPDVFKWWIDIKVRYSAPECQLNGDQLTCEFIMTDDGCITASGNTHGLPLRYNFTMQDGDIQRILVEIVGNDDWNSYGKWLAEEEGWEKAYRAAERANVDSINFSKGGDVAVKLCQDYADFLEKQVPVITASAQALVDAINGGDIDAAVALLTDDAEFQVWTDEAAGAEQLRPLFDWLAGKGTQYQITDCTWEAIDLLCAMSVVDDCTTAYGATDGLPGKVRFYALEDGTLQRVSGALTVAQRKPYQTWLEAETAWASANRADELAQAEGYSQEAGAMAVKLCQEYAETLK